MRTTSSWAFWRRFQYGAGLTIFLALVLTGIYFSYFYAPATCFDGEQNGLERGIDCGGTCTRVCVFDIIEPKSLWALSFKIQEGQYNAVAYIENNNLNVGTPEIGYTFGLYDADGLIVERSGTTVLPPDSVYPIFEGKLNTGTRIPTQTFIELHDADLWLPADSGRERFVVGDRDLTGADVRPRLDATITNTDVVEVADVEIVATIFDASGNALTASRTSVPRFLGKEEKDIVFTWPLPIAKTIRSCDVPTDVILAIDLSGSMNNDGGTPPEPVTSVLAAAETFVKSLKNTDQVGVVTFATEATLESQLMSNDTNVSNIISDLTIDPAEETGNTNTGDAITFAEQELLSERHNDSARKVLVLLTDGLTNAPGDKPETYAIAAAKSLKEGGVEVFTIGLGNSVNKEFMQTVSSGTDHYYQAASAATIDRIYREITGAICEDGAAVIDIIPKTGASFAPLR